MIIFLITLSLILLAVWQWDVVEDFAMDIGDYIDETRDIIANTATMPWHRLAYILAGAIFYSALVAVIFAVVRENFGG